VTLILPFSETCTGTYTKSSRYSVGDSFQVEFQPFCLFCEDDKMKRLSCERDMVFSTKHKVKGVQVSTVPMPNPSFGACALPSSSSSSPQPYDTTEEECLNYSRYVSPLTNGYCRDTASILGANNLDLLSPLLALEHEEAFPIVRSFLTHLLKEYKMVKYLCLSTYRHCPCNMNTFTTKSVS